MVVSAQVTTSAPDSPDTGRVTIVTDAVKRVPGEIGDIFLYPFEQPAEFSKYALGVGLLIALDRPITTAYQRWVETPLSGFKLPDAPGPFKNAGTGGTDGWLLLGISGTYLGGLALDDPLAQKAGLAAAKSVVYSVVISQVLLKSLTGRKRPLASLSNGTPDGTYTNNPYDFGNSRPLTYSSEQLNSSFPSFHFTMWFAAAKVYQEAYDSYLIPYSVAAVGLASNIRGHRHWVSDMTAGALIGTLIGSVVSKGYFEDKHVKVDVSFDHGAPFVLFSRQFW